MKKDLSEDEIRASIIDKLDRRGKWGGCTQNKDLLEKDIMSKLKHDGKVVNKIIENMIKGQELILGKSGNVISLNPRFSYQLRKFRDQNLP